MLKPTNEPLVLNLSDKKKKRPPWLRSYYRPFFYFAVPLSLLNIVFSLFFWKFLPPFIPLFYTLAQNSEKLADKKWLFILPGLSIVINFFHFQVIYFARNYDVFLLKIFEYFTIFIQLLLLATTLRIILTII